MDSTKLIKGDLIGVSFLGENETRTGRSAMKRNDNVNGNSRKKKSGTRSEGTRNG